MKGKIAILGMVFILLGILFELYLAQAWFDAATKAAFAVVMVPDEPPMLADIKLQCSSMLEPNKSGRIILTISNTSGVSLPFIISMKIEGADYTLTPSDLSIEETIVPNQPLERQWSVIPKEVGVMVVEIFVSSRSSLNDRYWDYRSCGSPIRNTAGFPGKVVQVLSAFSTFLGTAFIAPWLYKKWRISKGKIFRRAALFFFILALSIALIFSVLLTKIFLV